MYYDAYLTRYRVTAGNGCLRTFGTFKTANEYARAVIQQSHPNIGNVAVEIMRSGGWDWTTIKNYGPPRVRNARFLVYIHGNPVKITLRPGQSLYWSRGGPCDEGWSRETQQWTHNGESVRRYTADTASDCDGTHASYGEYSCPLDRLQSGNAPGWIEPEFPTAEPDTWTDVIWPEWNEVSASQRDQFAEVAGY